MAVVERWWNGRFGRMARRDVWLKRTWRVEWRQGDGDSPVTGKDFDDEQAARAWLRTVLARGKVHESDQWRDLTETVQTRPADRR